MSVCVGQCFEVVDGVLQLQVDPAGGLECTPAGLKANFPAGVVVPGVSPDACNGFQLRGNGYYAPCPEGISFVYASTFSGITPFEISSDGAGTFEYPSDVVTITNDKCCTVAGRISVRAGGLYINAHNGFYGECSLYVDNGAGFIPAFPDTNIVFENHQGVDVHSAFNNLLDENYLAIAAGGGSATYQAKMHIVVHAGSATLSGTPQFEINWVLPQTDCGC